MDYKLKRIIVIVIVVVINVILINMVSTSVIKSITNQLKKSNNEAIVGEIKQEIDSDDDTVSTQATSINSSNFLRNFNIFIVALIIISIILIVISIAILVKLKR